MEIPEKRPREPWEAKFLADWLPRRFPRPERLLLSVRVGAVPTHLDGKPLTWPERRMLGVFNRFVDAIVIEGGTLYLIEASLGAKLEKAAQVEMYLALLDETEELAEILALPRRGVVLVAQEDGALRKWCAARGIEVVYHRPPFIEDYLAKTLRKDLGSITRRAVGP